MRKLCVVSGRRMGVRRVGGPFETPGLAQVLCDGTLIGSLRERAVVTLEIDTERHIIQELPDNPGRIVSDVVNIAPGKEDVSLLLTWSEQTLFLSLY